jgi:hypothetical protein
VDAGIVGSGDDRVAGIIEAVHGGRMRVRKENLLRRGEWDQEMIGLVRIAVKRMTIRLAHCGCSEGGVAKSKLKAKVKVNIQTSK